MLKVFLAALAGGGIAGAGAIAYFLWFLDQAFNRRR